MDRECLRLKASLLQGKGVFESSHGPFREIPMDMIVLGANVSASCPAPAPGGEGQA